MSKKTDDGLNAAITIVDELESAAPAEGAENTMGMLDKVLVIPERGLNLRGGPGPGFPILTILPKGALLEVLPLSQEYPGWCPVLANPMLGWVDARYIEPVKSEEG